MGRKMWGGEEKLRTQASPIEWLNPGLSAVTPHPRGHTLHVGDMREVVADVGNRYPNANLDAVGWSLRYLIRHAILFEDMGGEYNIPSVAIADSVTEFDANPR
ncbi:hypothetical protein DKX38_000598 [Salix brachista]|uniref:Uncharacterized protein n=1 Tax=Salix brachista TaxID=2182728 RepID=A0A5N5P106_9ROSI|nr:hypothetical protein DKX38_000598 [Salix brachista]